MIQNCEEWLIYLKAVLPEKAGELGGKKPNAVQQGKVQGPAPGEEEPQTPAQPGGCHTREQQRWEGPGSPGG